MIRVFLQATTTTTEAEVRRVVGDPLPLWMVLGAGALVLVVVVLGGLYLRSRGPARAHGNDGATHGT